MKKLSILIPTIQEDFEYLQRLKAVLDPQVDRFKSDVEIRYHDAGKQISTGEKRNILISQAEGEWTVFIDSDDLVPEYYVEEILKGLESNPDYVSIIGKMTTNGESKVDFEIKKGYPYIEVTRECLQKYPYLAHRLGWYVRFPNILTPIRKSIAEQVKFNHITQGEDYPWALAIHERGLIKTEAIIEKPMYWYQFRHEVPQISLRRRMRG